LVVVVVYLKAEIQLFLEQVYLQLLQLVAALAAELQLLEIMVELAALVAAQAAIIVPYPPRVVLEHLVKEMLAAIELDLLLTAQAAAVLGLLDQMLDQVILLAAMVAQENHQLFLVHLYIMLEVAAAGRVHLEVLVAAVGL
jgi:hypothetical protein